MKEVVIFCCLVFCLGMYGALARRSILGVLIGIEMMVNASCILFFFASKYWQIQEGFLLLIFVLAIAVAEAAIALAISIVAFESFKSSDIERFKELKE